MATLGWWAANKHLRVHHSHSVEQEVEWMYAFDIHCNAYLPLFVLLHVAQYLLLPVLCGPSFGAVLLANTLYACGAGAYCYVTFLGYMYLPFLERTEYFLYPIGAVGVLYVLAVVLRINVASAVLGLYL